MISILCLGAALAVPSTPAVEAIDPGTRVRLTFERDADPLAPAGGRAATRRAGRLIAVGDRTITVAFDGHSRAVEFDKASVAGLERSLGGRSRGKRAARGAAMGLVAGFAGGALIGFASGDDECNPKEFLGCFLAYSAEEKAGLYAIALGTLGTVGGAVGGAVQGGERWGRGATVFGNDRVGVHLVPAGRRGAGVSVSLGF